MGLIYTQTKQDFVMLPSLSMDFDASRWDPLQDSDAATNCYSYALDAPELGIVNLGVDARKSIAQGTPQYYNWSVTLSEMQMHHLAESDGLERIQEHAFNPKKHHVVALFGGMVPPTEMEQGDFHFYRLDGDGSWSNQPFKRAPISRTSWQGETLSLNNLWQDYAHNKCAWNFVGYYKVPDKGMCIERTGKKELNLQIA